MKSAIAGPAIGALALNGLAIAATWLAIGPGVASATPLLVWLLFCLAGSRKNATAAPLAVSLAAFLVFGWSMIRGALASIALMPLGSVPSMDQAALTAAFLGVLLTTLFWTRLGRERP